MPEIIFPKKEFQILDFESYKFWSKFLSIGECQPNMVADIFTQPPPLTPSVTPLRHKKASYGAVTFLNSLSN